MISVHRGQAFQVLGLALIVATMGACHFESRAAGGTQKDDAALQAVAVTFYRAAAQSDTAALDAITFGSATVLLAAGRSPPSLIAWRALPAIPESRTLAPGVRLVRAEVRPDGDFAWVHAVVAMRASGSGEEYEANDFLTVARRDGNWRIAHAVFGPWQRRTAP